MLGKMCKIRKNCPIGHNSMYITQSLTLCPIRPKYLISHFSVHHIHSLIQGFKCPNCPNCHIRHIRHIRHILTYSIQSTALHHKGL